MQDLNSAGLNSQFLPDSISVTDSKGRSTEFGLRNHSHLEKRTKTDFD